MDCNLIVKHIVKRQRKDELSGFLHNPCQDLSSTALFFPIIYLLCSDGKDTFFETDASLPTVVIIPIRAFSVPKEDIDNEGRWGQQPVE